MITVVHAESCYINNSKELVVLGCYIGAMSISQAYRCDQDSYNKTIGDGVTSKDCLIGVRIDNGMR